ncbi:MAG: hypothetical protein OHK0013_01030 [Sandaracinaceae bacterium]
MQPDPYPTQSDEVRGLAWLLALGAAALATLFAFQPDDSGARSVTTTGSETRGVTMGALGPLQGPTDGPSPTPATHASGPTPSAVAHEDDPQMQAYRQSYRGGVDAGLPQPFAIAYHHGTLVSAAGVEGLAPGARCEVRVLPVQSYAFNCLLRVMCDDVVIYPDDALRAGYAPCEIEGSEAVSAVDDSSHDGDREIRLDVRGRSVLVQEHARDGAPRLEARVLLES